MPLCRVAVDEAMEESESNELKRRDNEHCHGHAADFLPKMRMGAQHLLPKVRPKFGRVQVRIGPGFVLIWAVSWVDRYNKNDHDRSDFVVINPPFISTPPTFQL